MYEIFKLSLDILYSNEKKFSWILMKIIFDEIMNQEYEKSNLFLALNFGNFKLEFLRKKDKQK